MKFFLLSQRRSVVGRGWACFFFGSLPARCACLCAYGVGLSLISYRSISVAPVRGGTYFSLPAVYRPGTWLTDVRGHH